MLCRSLDKYQAGRDGYMILRCFETAGRAGSLGAGETELEPLTLLHVSRLLELDNEHTGRGGEARMRERMSERMWQQGHREVEVGRIES